MLIVILAPLAIDSTKVRACSLVAPVPSPRTGDLLTPLMHLHHIYEVAESQCCCRCWSLLSPYPTEALSCVQFAVELEQCIRDAAKRAVDSWPRWGDGCLEATTKVDIQADVLGETITPFEETYGYQAALWCAFYSTRMTEEPDPDNPQPNNPDFEVRGLPYSQWLPRSQRSVGSDASVDYSFH